ncbi:MerR family transcriptional regulator [Rhodococcus sp. 14-2470-1a]|uniref:MerR family transcriptional regulator n=1 Tax=Rhodococcus sp. 14-2470-1a TaxID=2023150 RepID=UPI000B9B3689|nr:MULTISPECIES: MerR family transcriptional regulator [unclassified Rhodococcus (in: high G+C Gram-positive bacteria)]OZD62320.1 MerR family transcriptional regulator [Rhodococcus sp. 06-1059B-a]OZE82338.1 MerR family transcriptional regulator [Rhodococcus sp. 15-649-1-2]OZF04623.1 MerR family transcriptional regulator [Rhodococcus sp. 15-1154-1]OZF54381.1 MerR family transcriptional regulator [Rhodococcus sp. 14-2470-1a]
MMEYRVDDLARRAGVSVRNVRVYQDRGLLPPPRKEGRTGWYSESHLARLELISRMLDRGYTFATISELLIAAQSGLRIEDVLTADDVDDTARRQRESTHVTREDITRKFARGITDDELDRGVALGVLARSSDGYRVDQPDLLDAATLLHDAGTSVGRILDETEAVQKDLDDVAARFVSLITDKFVGKGKDPFDTDALTVGQLATLIDNLRPLTHRVVGALFREAMEHRITLTMEEMVAQYSAEGDTASEGAALSQTGEA